MGIMNSRMSTSGVCFKALINPLSVGSGDRLQTSDFDV